MPRPDRLSDGLELEASAIHRAIFRAEPTAVVLERYAAAHRRGIGVCSEAEGRWLESVVKRGHDLEALELALRRRDARHALVRKFRVMAYVTEGSPGYLPFYINQRPSQVKAVVELGRAALRSAWKSLKGSLLLRATRCPFTT